MDEITFNTPSIIKLGSFAGKIKYCLIDTYFISLLNIYKLKINYINNQLIVIATNGLKDIPLHNLIWEYFYQYSISENYSIYHQNGITMDNRLENLLLISNNIVYLPLKSYSLSSFYWKIISYLPVDMDEVNYHSTKLNRSSLYECHNAPCTQLLLNSSDEQFICLKCKKIKYCSQMCQTMDADIHSIFCNPNNSK
ncbi:unnamed protein product [Rotaria sp. Silwood1]|nr:unnamed protein product [Rotaria sp. Silwood1]CAF0738155.1 unnamed protein product [Rotaria sp. Silwood1]CAF0792975.1 unnamed protein product [Rotaria sp. Silwood1]CAF3327192.1 unnamed protein product [Rotaria sp. Silwood1]CAF3334604.1 unnamed protein product [Rotaria sp. Silwood1]